MTSGAIAIVTSTLATVVIVIATMKAVNITDQQAPESQSVAPPLRKVWPSVAPAAQPGEQDHAAPAALKKLRQKVASKPAGRIVRA